ncbi:hypothetical protein [Photorhabdus sp. MH8.4]
MTGVSERSQQRGNLKDNGYTNIQSKSKLPPIILTAIFGELLKSYCQLTVISPV